MTDQCEKEIVKLHRFFEEWFMARLADSGAAFSRFAGVMADGFIMISADGTVTTRAVWVAKTPSAAKSQMVWRAAHPMDQWEISGLYCPLSSGIS